jgi:hypothetical protein
LDSGEGTDKVPPRFHFGLCVESVDACSDFYERIDSQFIAHATGVARTSNSPSSEAT